MRGLFRDVQHSSTSVGSSSIVAVHRVSSEMAFINSVINSQVHMVGIQSGGSVAVWPEPYEAHTDQLHYVTRFIDGLKPEVRVLVAVQLPQDLHTTYTIACVQEEVGEGLVPATTTATSGYRRTVSNVVSQFKPTEERKTLEYHKPVVANTPFEDKLIALRNYRRAKNLCFTCGEKFSRDHKCHSTVQLHVVQEMVEFLTHSPSSSMDINDGTDDMELMHLADIGPDDPIPEQSIVLHCTIQGKPVLFLLDSGSNNSIISAQISAQFSGQQKLSRPRRVKVAGGGILNRDSYIPHCA